LCGHCHREVHRYGDVSRETGFIVSQYVDDPSTVPVKAWFGNINLDCNGFFDYVVEETEKF